MNYHSNEWIMGNMWEHYEEAAQYFPRHSMVVLAYQGSANYSLDTFQSDVDTKLIVTPSFYDLAMNRQPISTTHVRENNSHTDFKDVRLYMQTFRKMNVNFLEILFTKYYLVTSSYEKQWNRLIEARECIARYDVDKGVRSMTGQAHTKHKNMFHVAPSTHEDIEKFGYSRKDLHHLLRIEEFLERYIAGEKYEDCLLSRQPEHLQEIKIYGAGTLTTAQNIADNAIEHIDSMHDNFLKVSHDVDPSVNDLLDDVQFEIMKLAIEKEMYINNVN